MEKKELRIGNLVMDFDGKIYEVEALNTTCWLKGTGSRRYETLRGVPLIAEILLKYGFAKAQNDWFEIKYFSREDADDINVISINPHSKRCNINTESAECEGSYAAHKIQYVHQLQNLYHALTGKELESFSDGE